MKNLLLVSLFAITLSHAAEDNAKAIVVTPETTIAGAVHTPNPLLTINEVTKTLSDHVTKSAFPTNLALAYDSGSLAGGTAAYKRVTVTTWAELGDPEREHFAHCLSEGSWVLFSIKSLSRGYSHCLYLGSNNQMDAYSNICGLSWS